jgi:hypothetical protein
MREKEPRNVVVCPAKRSEAQDLAVVDPELPLVKPGQHDPHECSARLWKGNQRNVRLMQPPEVAPIACQAVGSRARNSPHKLRCSLAEKGHPALVAYRFAQVNAAS